MCRPQKTKMWTFEKRKLKTQNEFFIYQISIIRILYILYILYIFYFIYLLLLFIYTYTCRSLTFERATLTFERATFRSALRIPLRTPVRTPLRTPLRIPFSKLEWHAAPRRAAVGVAHSRARFFHIRGVRKVVFGTVYTKVLRKGFRKGV